MLFLAREEMQNFQSTFLVKDSLNVSLNERESRISLKKGGYSVEGSVKLISEAVEFWKYRTT